MLADILTWVSKIESVRLGTASFGRLAEVVRGGDVESIHDGFLVALAADGTIEFAVGESNVQIWPRSTVKPFQAVAMVRNGLQLPERLLALAAASHNGEPEHLAGVREILTLAHLDESALQNTPDLPWGSAASREWLAAGGKAESITQNCSGKHAAMLLTCVTAGWDIDTYLQPEHPLQQAIAATLAEFTGGPLLGTTADGCGAPLFATTLLGLATAFARLTSPANATDSAEARVAQAMRAHPFLIAGSNRPTTTLMRAIDGLVAKDGADGVYAAGLADGRAVALKIRDGAERPLAVALVAALDHLGATSGIGTDELAIAALRTRTILGGGEPVGEIRPAFE